MYKKLLCYTIFIYVLFNSCVAGTIDPRINDDKYVEYGSKFKCVAKICGQYHDHQKFCASAVVINKNWIITAAHVVKNSVECYISIDSGPMITVSKIVVHDKFDHNLGSNDIALGYTTKNLILESYPQLYRNNNEINKICSISGYGLTGDFNTGVVKSDNKKRAGSNIIDKIEKELLICSPSKDDNRTALEYMICSGDSGGGLFIDQKLAGINSCIISVKIPDSTWDDESGHTRISSYIEWIEKNIKDHVDNSQESTTIE